MELDIENFDALRKYLTERGDIHVGQKVAFNKLLGGVSNRTVRSLRTRTEEAGSLSRH